jgi:hypothetical protein
MRGPPCLVLVSVSLDLRGRCFAVVAVEVGREESVRVELVEVGLHLLSCRTILSVTLSAGLRQRRLR